MIAMDALIELVLGQMLNQLSEDRFAYIHPGASSGSAEVDYRMNREKLSSNRKIAYWSLHLFVTTGYRTLAKR